MFWDALTNHSGSHCSPSSATYLDCPDECILLYLLSTLQTLSLESVQRYKQTGTAQKVMRSCEHTARQQTLWRKQTVSKTSAAFLLPRNGKPGVSWPDFFLASVCQYTPSAALLRSCVTHLFMISAACLVRAILPPFKIRFIMERYLKQQLQLPASF